MLKADVCVISDTSMRTIEEPAITHSLRGMTYIEIEVEGPKEDLHSGLWGGAAHNPALALVEILGKLYNPDNTIAVPGFYDDVVPLTDAEREMIAKTAERGAVQSDDGRPGNLGRRELHHPRANLRPPDAGHQRDVEWLDWPWTQDDHPPKSRCEAQLSPGRQPGPEQDIRPAEGLY